jgi:hypothetical protein
MRSRASLTLTGMLAVAVLSLVSVTPAHADQVRNGVTNCSNVSRLVRVSSTTTNTGGGSFSVVHSVNKNSVLLQAAWTVAGAHQFTSSHTSGTWVVNTNKTINSAGGSCAGL